ncbi:DUF2809 domain-containing protein [uncultured Cellulomonas sp.]|uniref:DUF2809 domain-containing protein n=1 Tax=uncultured Cellulomonas sp. TaxID=189682 RepID=UPI00260C6E37|nr:DUF2809 domain-containing protein [uncultured Cellulomonas sp.]
MTPRRIGGPPATTGGVPRPRGARRRRVATALAAVPVVASGLAVHTVGGRLDGAGAAVADGLGDALFAALVVALAAVCRPAGRPWQLGLTGLAVCTALELAQLTGVPAALAERWWPARLVLGTTFHAPDLVAYLAGAAAAGGVLWCTSHGGRLTAAAWAPMDARARRTTPGATPQGPPT